MRIGHGFDVHKFGGTLPLKLCGVEVSHPEGLEAHSDGDVAIHAFCDALIGAMGEGDIGHWFPDSDSSLKDIDSTRLLHQVMTELLKNYQLVNADITLIAQVPKLAPYIEKMKQKLASICCCQASQLNIKATTTERLGYIGREEGIAAHAVVLIKKPAFNTK